MAFVVEKISDEDREKFNINAFNWGNGSAFHNWAVDHTREAYFLLTGPGKERNARTWLIYKGSVNTALCDYIITEKNTVEYKVYRLEVQENLLNEVETIKLLMAEAFVTYWESKRMNFTNTEIHIIPQNQPGRGVK